MFHELTMWREKVPARVMELPADRTLRLPPARGETVIRVERGTVVVTREGDGEDHVLGAGAELRLPGRGLAVAWALAESRVVVWHDRRGGVAPRRGLPVPVGAEV